MLRDKNQGEDVITGLRQKTHFGRPQWGGIFQKIADSNPRYYYKDRIYRVVFHPWRNLTIYIRQNKLINTSSGMQGFECNLVKTHTSEFFNFGLFFLSELMSVCFSADHQPYLTHYTL